MNCSNCRKTNEHLVHAEVSLNGEIAAFRPEIIITTGTCGTWEANLQFLYLFGLDFCRYSADTSGNTLAAPLFRQVMCLWNDVHQGRVIFFGFSIRESLQ